MPTNLPIGVSPDCPNCAFVPGTVMTRAAFQRVFGAPFSEACVFGASFVDPTGNIRNLYFDQGGNFWVENVSTSPGSYTLLFTSTPGSYCRSTVSFGRAYLAISDGLHGAEVPLQYDGTFLDRFTSDGPGSAPTVTNVILPPSTLLSSTGVEGSYVIIPVQGGGTVAISVGQTATYGTSIPLPSDEYNTANMLSWSTAGAGSQNSPLTGIAGSTSADGVLQAEWQVIGGPTPETSSNWGAVFWTDGANVTLTTETYGGYSFQVLTFTTLQGDPLAIVTSFLRDGASMYIPTGFSSSNWICIAGAASIDNTTNVWDYLDCYFGSSEGSGSPGTVLTCRYSDFNLNRTYGSANVLGIFWQSGGGITTQSVLNGTAVLIPTFQGVTGCLISAVVPSNGSFGLPAGGYTLLDTTTSVNSAQGSAGSSRAVGMRVQSCTGQTYQGVFISFGDANEWLCNGNVLAVAYLGAPSANTLVRNNNTVTATTAEPHGLQVGYQAQISGVLASAVGTSIVSIVLSNEDNPGIATVTTSTAHGLLPENSVTISGVVGAPVSSITTASRAGGYSTITTPVAHGLSPGSLVTISGVSDGSFDGSYSVLFVPSPTTFVYAQTDADSPSGSGGNVNLAWPVPDTSTPSYFEVVASPSATTFQISLLYADGTWTGGIASFAWDGTFYVTKIIDGLNFQYQQYGPNATADAAGTVTPFGQAAPGLHQVRQSFLTRQGYLTRPGPFATFEANGGQYLQLSNLAIGPSYVVARVLEFTGASGATFFYIPAPAQVNGQVVSTATQINDNTTTTALLDFSDNTLFAGIGTSTQGNNTPNQIVLDGALGIGFFDERLVTRGQRNRIQNLLNLTFGGGYLASAPTLPTGWTSTTAGGQLIVGRFNGLAWQITTATGPGQLTQPMYEDCYGAPIATGNTLYKIRCYLAGAGEFQASITSISTSFSTSASISFTSSGWYEAVFAAETPSTIPTDVMFSIQGIAGTLTVSEISVIYDQTPYTDTVFNGSYIDNPEAFDGVTGKFGPALDARKLMDFAVIRDTMFALTQDPAGRLHEIADNGTTEPNGWPVNEVASNCGLLSAFSLTRSQADDSSASGGEEWMAWASESGARIFSGSEPWKISQEIQPNWNETGSLVQINMAAATTIWTLNDPVERTLYFGLPLGTATQPSQIYAMNYRELDNAGAIASSPPYRTSFTGKLIATDNTRKWSYWTVSMFGGARMYRTVSELSTCFFGGPFFNVYTLNPNLSTDDDFGTIASYYITCALPTRDQEQGLQLGSGRKLLTYMSAFLSGVGQGTITPLLANLTNAWTIVSSQTLSAEPEFDWEWGAGSPESQRMFFKVAVTPFSGQTDARFSLQRFIPWFRRSRIQVRGAAQ